MNRIFLICFAVQLCGVVAGAHELRVYFGTYTGGRSRGICLSEFDDASGKLSLPVLVAEAVNPAFLALHPNGKFLYSISEVSNAQGKSAGAVQAFAVDTGTGKLRALNGQTSGGAGPCHLSIDATGQCLLVANYGSGSVAAFPIRADGSLGEAATAIQHTGSGANPQRQSGPHAHFICPSPDNHFALACDLGLDKILIYKLVAANAKISPNDPPFAMVPSGAGPRHLVFSRGGRFLFVVNELGVSVSAFRYDAANGSLSPVGNFSTMPDGYIPGAKDSAAEIALHPNGRFLYVSNRGHDSIAIFSIDSVTGQLTLIGHQPTLGKTPRHFALDPTGRWLLAENQDSGSVVVFSVDPATGGLKPTGNTAEIASPVCAVFAPAGPTARQ